MTSRLAILVLLLTMAAHAGIVEDVRDALAQIRLAFVQIKSAGGAPPKADEGPQPES